MSEEQQVQGDRWTIQTLNILKQFGWEKKVMPILIFLVLVLINLNMEQQKKAEKKNPHGIDLLLSYFDP
ncbi:hypothetical protein BsIDN1_46210 [Bacillus safensis]|uniref:Uncharacterized protein n=1 Tax=Bacillus safensis TaxID=561879 RepID=A0A5S9MCZ1_BACIA|nr:hypothetical protein BsIDN1_46210 [Bacillus safensis]